MNGKLYARQREGGDPPCLLENQITNVYSKTTPNDMSRVQAYAHEKRDQRLFSAVDVNAVKGGVPGRRCCVKFRRFPLRLR